MRDETQQVMADTTHRLDIEGCATVSGLFWKRVTELPDKVVDLKAYQLMADGTLETRRIGRAVRATGKGLRLYAERDGGQEGGGR